MARVGSVRPTNFTLEWIRELTLRYTTPDIHCRHRRHECDGGISTDRVHAIVVFFTELSWTRFGLEFGVIGRLIREIKDV